MSTKRSTGAPQSTGGSPLEAPKTTPADLEAGGEFGEVQTESPAITEQDLGAAQAQEPVDDTIEAAQPGEIAATEPASEPPLADPDAPSLPVELSSAQPEAIAPAESEPEQMHMQLDSPTELAPTAPPLAVPDQTAPAETEAFETASVEVAPEDIAAAVANPVEPAPVEPLPVETGQAEIEPAQSQAVEVGPVEITPQDSALQSTPTFEDETHLAVSGDDQPQSAEPRLEQAAVLSPASATSTASVLSLLDQTTRLPAHLRADVAGCAAELRAILAAG